MVLKRCCTCQAERPVAEFSRNRTTADGYQRRCKACVKAHYGTTRPAILLRHRAYYQHNKARCDAASRAWAQAHPERRRAQQQGWIARHPEKRRDVNLASWKRHYAKNRERIYATVRQRAARLKGAAGRVSAQEWQDILQTFNHHCAYCLTPFTEACRPTQDHMWPLVQGGPHSTENIVPACRSCNSRKQRRPLLPWAAAAA